MNLGFGMAQLKGNNNNVSGSFYMPIFIHQYDYLGWEFKPSVVYFNGSKLLDLDGSVVLTYKMFSTNIGIRSLITEGEDITGPYVGLSFHY